jgi:hypothetical protein
VDTVIVEVFDDWKSVIHTVVGGATYFFPLLSIIFLIYELAEYLLRYDSIKCTYGDICEFSIGFTIVGLLCEFVRW